jgi:serine/threonine-protein kinase RsbW
MGIFRELTPYQSLEPHLMVRLSLSNSTETVNRTLDSTLASVDIAENDVLELAGRAGFAGLSLARIGLAVREITTNAIVHGNRYHLGKKVFLAVSRTPARLEVTIADQGAGFDLSSVSDPRSPETLLRPSGRGIYLAQVFIDELHVRRGDLCGVAVELVKYVNRYILNSNVGRAAIPFAVSVLVCAVPDED